MTKNPDSPSITPCDFDDAHQRRDRGRPRYELPVGRTARIPNELRWMGVALQRARFHRVAWLLERRLSGIGIR